MTLSIAGSLPGFYCKTNGDPTDREDRPPRTLKGRRTERVFIEKMSAAKSVRPDLRRVLDSVRDSDMLVVGSIYRLARCTS